MTTTRRNWVLILVIVLLTGLVREVPAQGTLSQQVLALLSRTNAWIGQNTFYDIRIPFSTIPSDTDARIYADTDQNLYYNGGLIAGAGGGVTPHNLLSSTHPDTEPGSPATGAVVVGDGTPKWAALAPGVGYLRYDGAATLFSQDGADFTNLPAEALSGTSSAFDGNSIYNLSASNLDTGTVPLARLVDITNTEISASAAIAYSKLNLTGGIVDADVSGSAAIGYAKLDVANSLVAGDLTAGAVTMAKIDQASATAGQVIAWSGSAWAPTSLSSGGSVTSVALALPGIFTVSGSPVTTTGTLTGALASQTQNLIWASPDGSSGSPTFRALLNADLPTSGASAGTYPKVTVNTRGIVTSGASQITLSTDVTGILPRANGGTGIATAADDTMLIGSGTAWVQTALPACTRLLSYSTGTNLVTCTATAAMGTLTASAPLSVTATWNNGGITFSQFLVNVTDTASAAGSTLLDLQIAGTSKFTVRKDGAILQPGIALASLGTPADGTITYCTDCAPASDPCTGSSTGTLAIRRDSTWACF